ncbi:diguanylate cyclase [Nocardia higoensis]|uniref:Diguanylate cyclase n=1 Tax=Nocardia higoensis TaxID=228599 RepID=A0ABS0DHE5_9NOCA|nr:diguanylate cyclase [Nocardia higoensis]MBF6357871.1 diguanylate cyclase [Nocardia higoensis]
MGEELTNDAVDAEQLAQRYRALIEHTPDGICVHEHGIVVYVNHAAVRLVGAHDASDVVGQPLTRFVDRRFVPAMLHRISRLTTAGAASAPTEMELRRLDGSTVPVETVSVLTPWYDHYAYQVVIHDLSAQRAAEDAQRRAEQHFTAVVSQLEEGVVVIARGGVIESANPAALRIFGAVEHADDLIGRAIEDLPLVLLDANSKPLPVTEHPMARTLATGEPFTGYIFGVDRRDGQRRWLSGSSRLLNPGDRYSSAVSSFSDITEFRASRRQLEYQATHDSLTGLANRALILSQLAGALAATSDDLPVTMVLFIDLDEFKSINDSLGHATGDTVLQIVAQRLQRALRGGDLIGRLGGDEFLVLLSADPARVDMDDIIERLRAAMAEPIIANGHRIEVRASVGGTALAPGDPRTPEAVLHDADVAMYRAKPPGRRDRFGTGHHRGIDSSHVG